MVTVRTSRPDTVVVAGVGVVGFGVVILVLSLLFLGRRVVGTIKTAPVATPADVTRHLSAGTWFVYQNTEFQPSATASPEGYPPGSLQLSQLVVTGPNGQRPDLGLAGLPSALTVGTGVYLPAVEFSAATSGNYNIRVDAPNTEIMVATQLAIRFQVNPVAAFSAAAGGVTTIAGITLLAIGKVRRRRAKPVARSEWVSSSGGYPGA